MSTRDVINRLLRDGKTVARGGTTHDVFPVPISTDEGQALKRWVERERASATIEIGLAYAVSALYILEGLMRTAEAPDTRPFDYFIDF